MCSTTSDGGDRSTNPYVCAGGSIQKKSETSLGPWIELRFNPSLNIKIGNQRKKMKFMPLEKWPFEVDHSEGLLSLSTV